MLRWDRFGSPCRSQWVDILIVLTVSLTAATELYTRELCIRCSFFQSFDHRTPKGRECGV